MGLEIVVEMHTSLSMLDGIRDGSASAWVRFDGAYSAFIGRQLARLLFVPSDVEEVRQDVMVVLLEKMKGFEWQRAGAFRTFLREICYRKACERLAKNRRGQSQADQVRQGDFARVEELADPQSEMSRLWDEEHRQFAQEIVLSEARKRCGPKKIDLFCELQRKERSRDEIAKLYRISPATLFRTQAEVASALRAIQNEWGEVLDLVVLPES